MMEEAERALAAGISVMLFPEGTRSDTGALLPFKDGAFSLAIRTQVPILPIALTGTREMRPKHSKWFGKANARARVLAPIPTVGLDESSVGDVRDRARRTIQDALDDLRGTPASARPAAAADGMFSNG
jgi:1-acyl-sn-glycerol-3-phosphate acyltransferase